MRAIENATRIGTLYLYSTAVFLASPSKDSSYCSASTVAHPSMRRLLSFMSLHDDQDVIVEHDLLATGSRSRLNGSLKYLTDHT